MYVYYGSKRKKSSWKLAKIICAYLFQACEIYLCSISLFSDKMFFFKIFFIYIVIHKFHKYLPAIFAHKRVQQYGTWSVLSPPLVVELWNITG